MSWYGKKSELRMTFRSEMAVGFEWTPMYFPTNGIPCSPHVDAFDNAWLLILHTNGCDTSSRDWIGLDLIVSYVPECTIRVTIGVLKGAIKRTIINQEFLPDITGKLRINKLVRKSELLDSKCRLQLCGELTISCELRIDEPSSVKGMKSVSRETQTEGKPDTTARDECREILDTKVDSTLLKHLQDLLLTGDDHDVVIKVRNQEFKAHRNMLRARSPVFAAMFKHDMKESADGSISIDDCDPDAFGEFLNYVYTGNVEDLSPRKAAELYYAGDKYDFSGLKELCVRFLEASLSPTSICDVISLATKHDEKDLLEKAMKFFTANTTEILVTVEWQRFAASNFVTANELCIRAFKALERKEVNE